MVAWDGLNILVLLNVPKKNIAVRQTAKTAFFAVFEGFCSFSRDCGLGPSDYK